MVQSLKKALRKSIKEKIEKIDEQKRKKKSSAIKRKLFCSFDFKKAETIMFYLSKEDEVDTWDMIQEAFKMGKRIAVPYFLEDTCTIQPFLISEGFDKNLEKTRLGFCQPQKGYGKKTGKNDLDLVVVPGLAFDKKGNRLGRGKGCYDKFLAKLSKRVKTIGIAFSCQIVNKLPISLSDIPVQKVLYA